MWAIALFAASPCPDVPDVVLSPKLCREVSLATSLSVIPLCRSLSQRPLAVSTSINERQVRIHANYSTNQAKWEHSARSTQGCQSNTFLPIFSVYLAATSDDVIAIIALLIIFLSYTQLVHSRLCGLKEGS